MPEITARAGLTTRTFFRHFPDKREVLVAGEEDVPTLVDAIAGAFRVRGTDAVTAAAQVGRSG